MSRMPFVPLLALVAAACGGADLPDPTAVPASSDTETGRARELAEQFVAALTAGDGDRAWELADETRAVPLLVYVAGEGPVAAEDFLRAEAIGAGTLDGFAAGLGGVAPATEEVAAADLEAAEPPAPWSRYWVFRISSDAGFPLPVGVGLDTAGATLVDVAGLFSVLRPDALRAFAADLHALPDDIARVAVAAQGPSATVVHGDVWTENITADLAAEVHTAATAFLDAAAAVTEPPE